MVYFQAAFVLSLAIAGAVASDPDCTRCEYQNGIGFVGGEFCPLYYMCIKSPNFNRLSGNPNATHDELYRWYAHCCAEGLAWDEEHLTCRRDSYCNESRVLCPGDRTTTDGPCPYYPDENDSTRYFTQFYDLMYCPFGQQWSPADCTCIATDILPPCRKILHYGFAQTFDSQSCYNFAVGEPYGKPYLFGNMLCLDGEDQFMSIPFLNNWFAWNPVARTFTLCFFIKAGFGQTSGVFSTNCYIGEDSLMDLWLENDFLVANLAGNRVETGKEIGSEDFAKVCVVFDQGTYTVYVDAQPCGNATTDPRPINSHADATLGYVQGQHTLYGYFDDFCFWTYALSSEEITECLSEGPSP